MNNLRTESQWRKNKRIDIMDIWQSSEQITMILVHISQEHSVMITEKEIVISDSFRIISENDFDI